MPGLEQIVDKIEDSQWSFLLAWLIYLQNVNLPERQSQIYMINLSATGCRKQAEWGKTKLPTSLPNRIRLGEFVQQFQITLVAGRGDFAFFHRLAHGAAFVVDMAAVVKTAVADVGLEFAVAPSQILTFDVGQAEHGNTGAVDQVATRRQMVERCGGGGVTA